MKRNRPNPPEGAGSLFPDMEPEEGPGRKPVVTSDTRTDYAQVVRDWLAPTLSAPPFDRTQAEISIKPGTPHIEVKLAIGDKVTAEEKRAIMSDIREWIRNTRPSSLMMETFAKPVYGNASQIAASRAHFKLSEPSFDAIKGAVTARFSFAGPESRQAFLQALAAQQADRKQGSGLSQRSA